MSLPNPDKIFDLARKLAETKGKIYANKTCAKCEAYYFAIDHKDIDGENKLGIWFTCKAIDSKDNKVCGSTMLILSENQRKLLEKHGRISKA